MLHATADDGVKLYYEETGAGVPVIFVHEFAGVWCGDCGEPPFTGWVASAVPERP
jgi:hypothetical protein